MRKADLTNYRKCGEYHRKLYTFREKNGILPHDAWRSNAGASHNRGLLVAKRTRMHWPLSVSAIKFFHEVETKGQIEKGYLVMEEKEEDKVIAVYTIGEVLERVKGKEPNEGVEGFGPYFFLDYDLELVPPGDFHHRVGNQF